MGIMDNVGPVVGPPNEPPGITYYVCSRCNRELEWLPVSQKFIHLGDPRNHIAIPLLVEE